MEAKLSRVTVMHDGHDGEPAFVHAFLCSRIPEEDVTHSVEALVVLQYTAEQFKRLTLSQIRTDALNRLPKTIELGS